MGRQEYRLGRGHSWFQTPSTQASRRPQASTGLGAYSAHLRPAVPSFLRRVPQGPQLPFQPFLSRHLSLVWRLAQRHLGRETPPARHSPTTSFSFSFAYAPPSSPSNVLAVRDRKYPFRSLRSNNTNG